MGKVSYYQKGYIGQSMSVRASRAYDWGEMPKSKWTKGAILDALQDYVDCGGKLQVELDDLKSLKRDDLFSLVCEYKGWHHTGKFAQETMFYGLLDEEALEQISSIDISCFKPTYKITNETMEHEGRILHRIQAVNDFIIPRFNKQVKKGDLGGFVESEANLSQKGNCWISGNAKVFDKASVSSNAIVAHEAIVKDCTHVAGAAVVSGEAVVSGKVTVNSFSFIGGNAEIFDEAFITDDAQIGGNAKVMDNACVACSASVNGDARIFDKSYIGGDVEVSGDTYVGGDARILIYVGDKDEKTNKFCIREGKFMSGRYEHIEDFEKVDVKNTLEQSVDKVNRGSEKHSPTEYQER